MALKSPLMPSPSGPVSHFSPYSDSPSSPAPFQSLPPHSNHSRHTSREYHSDSLAPPPSPYPQFIEPSPVDSNGTASTEVTDIDDDGDDDVDRGHHDGFARSPLIDSASPISPESLLGKIDTSIAARSGEDPDTGPHSVIHAPQGFRQFDSKNASPREGKGTTSPSQSSSNTIVSPTSPQSNPKSPAKRDTLTSPLNTDVPPAKGLVMETPVASTRQDLEEEWRRRSRRSIDLEDIPEDQNIGEGEADNENKDESDVVTKQVEIPPQRVQQINDLKDGLSQCWTLCNTLANLSSNHRSRIFSSRGQSAVQEDAWRSCWKLCQKLYESRDEDHQSQVLPTLEMCRDFCQALFEVRQKGDETTDSILRVSFELNNHLYNTHDRNLPMAFQERTLDFYLTLCHRLMKQRTSLPEETDMLLRACWSLAELLFSLRQNNRDGKPPDEELLGSAVQACWDLCDLFREGWAQVRPERGTPRPAQISFAHSVTSSSFKTATARSVSSSHSISRSSSTHSYHDTYNDPRSMPPETPTTIFDDSNEDQNDETFEEAKVPNILVLGPENNTSAANHGRWSSAASNYSESSQRTSSTATLDNSGVNFSRIRILLVKAAANAGFQRPRSPPGSSSSAASTSSVKQTQHANQALLNYVKAMPSNSFGSQAWQTNLLEKYRKLVVGWGTFARSAGRAADQQLIQPVQRRTTAAEVARAVQWIMRNEQYAWLRDLFRVVFGCFPDDAVNMSSTMIQA